MHTWPMALAGLTVSCLVPVLVRAARNLPSCSRVAVPPAVALPLFVLVHAAVTAVDSVLHPGVGVRLACTAGLLVSCALFWLPVLGPPARRLGGAGRCLYLYLSAPCLDLPAVLPLTLGHTAGGIAMIVTMLPIGCTALVTTWQWITEEERFAQSAAAHGPRPDPR